MNSNIFFDTSQAPWLDDKQAPWLDDKELTSDLTSRKRANLKLASIYEKLGRLDLAIRLRHCSTLVMYELVEDSFDGKFKEVSTLAFGNFCRARFCPICIWRRTLKLTSQLYDIIGYLDGQYSYIFLTLTVRNCEGPELRSTLADMQKGFRSFLRHSKVKAVVKGYYRGIEVTHDTDPFITIERYEKSPAYYDRQGLSVGDVNPNYNTYHPHYHVVLAVNKSYFKSRYYLKLSDWKSLWAESYGADYAPVVDVRAVKEAADGLKGAVHEVAKYPLKEEDYLTGDADFDMETVSTLTDQLANLRFMSMGGVFKRAHEALHLSDFDDPDDCISDTARVMDAVAYEFFAGYSIYARNDYLTEILIKAFNDKSEHKSAMKEYYRKKRKAREEA